MTRLILLFKLYLVVVLCMLSVSCTLALSQQAPERPFTFTVTAAELQLLSQSLEAMPYGRVAPLVQKLQQQIQGQLATTASPRLAPRSAEPGPGE